MTTTCEGSIRGQGSAIFRISTRWRRFRGAEDEDEEDCCWAPVVSIHIVNSPAATENMLHEDSI